MPFDSTPTEPRVAHDITIMRKIRAKIAAGHWCKNACTDFLGNRCVLGWWYHLDQTVNHLYPLRYLGAGIVEINDNPKTTKEHMIALLDRRIEKALVS